MNKFNIDLVNHVFCIGANHAVTFKSCSDYLKDASHEYCVIITPEDIEYERMKASREDAMQSLPPREFSEAYLETIALQRKITELLFDHDVLLFHGSVIAVDGEAYLFTARSGTGKSTHTRLWREMLGDRAVMVNDDKPFLRFEDGIVYAHGSPWNGKHRLGENICVPLKAICILERGEINRIRQITPAEALPMLLQQSSRPMNREKMPLYMDMIEKLTERVAFYRLQCNMDPEAAQVAWEAMRRKDG